MATIKLSSGSLSGTLWARNNEPLPKSNGLMLHVAMDAIQCTCVGMDPADVLRHAIGASDGSIFMMHIKRNRVAMVAKLPQSVSSFAFAIHRRDQIYCAALQSMFLVNVETCRIEKKIRSPHMNHVFRIMVDNGAPTSFVSISTDTIALWDGNSFSCRHNTREGLRAKAAPSKFVDACLTDRAVYAVQQLPPTTTSSGPVGVLTKYSSSTLDVVKRVSLGADRAPGCVASLGPNCVIVGCGAAPELLVFDSELNSISAVMLPGSAQVKSLVVVDTDLIAAHTADGRVWFVVVCQYSISFSLALPFTTPVVGIVASHATYLSVSSASDVYVYHLPSVKRFCDRTITGHIQNAGNRRATSTNTSTTVLPFVRTESDTTPDVPADASESYEACLPRQPIEVNDATSAEWVKANLVSHHDSASGAPRTLLLHEAVKELHAETSSGAPHQSLNASGAATQQRKPSAAPAAAAMGLTATTGHALNRAVASSGKTSCDTKNKKGTSSSSSPSAALPRQANIAVRSFLDHESRAVNMDKLRVMLMRYGTYPEKYRTLIWRFLLQLPEKRFLAPQYHALTEKGAHPGVDTLMEPFPLPRNKQRATFEAALSALAWNSPVLSVVHFVPNLLFPFVQLYGSDTQSAIEVFLAVLTNWGREFFSYYPHHPVAILSFLNHTLKAEDPELHQHLEECGVSVENWGWEVLRPLYTEVLTRNEWLQVMDHALSNEPIWLFLFHVRWVVQLREVLLQLHDYSQLVAMFRKTTPTNLNTVIHQAYHLRQRCTLGSIAAPYLSFSAFREYAYPVILECDEAVITTKLRELERVAQQQNEARASQKLVLDIKSRIAQAAMLEDAFVGKQRAMVAAKMEAANESWVQQVQLEKERQRLRDIEHETRLVAMQEQLRSAQRLEGLQHETNAASQSARDADVDRQREVTKWDFSDRMSAQEMNRLETSARMKLQCMLKTTSVLADGSDEDIVQLAVREDAVPPILPESLMDQHIHEEQHRHHTRVSPPPPPPPPPAAAYMPSAHRDPIGSASVRDGQTMTELPPLPPSTSSRSDSINANAASGVPEPQPYNVQYEDKSGVEPPTSTSSSTCASDPLHYYQQLQRTIKQGVERAQREQKHRLEALESRFARQLGSEDEATGSSEVTEVAVADTTTTTSTTASSSAGNSNRNRDTAAHQHHTYVLEDNMADNDDVEQRHQRRHPHHGVDETCSLLASSGASTSMTKVILKPQNPDFFKFHKSSGGDGQQQ